jgi:hypothetical protein
MIINLREVIKCTLIIPLIFFLVLSINFVRADNIETYPEAIIKYDINSKNFIVMPYDSNTNISFVEKCMDKRCNRKIESYFLINPMGNKLNVAIQHDKSISQDSFNLISLKYNNNKKIKFSNKFLIIDSKRKISSQFSNKTSSVVLDFDKKTNKTKIQIKENKKTNNNVADGMSFIEVRTNKGRLNYNLINEGNFKKDDNSNKLINNLNFYYCNQDSDCTYVINGCCESDIINKNMMPEWFKGLNTCKLPCLEKSPVYPICEYKKCIGVEIRKCSQDSDCKSYSSRCVNKKVIDRINNPDFIETDDLNCQCKNSICVLKI